MTSRSAWKRRERAAAALFGSRRAPLSGSNGGQTGSDSLHPDVYLETKLRAKSAVHALFDRTAEAAKREGKTPCLALAMKNRPGFLIVLRPEDIHVMAGNLVPMGTKPPDGPCGRCRKGGE